MKVEPSPTARLPKDGTLETCQFRAGLFEAFRVLPDVDTKPHLWPPWLHEALELSKTKTGSVRWGSGSKSHFKDKRLRLRASSRLSLTIEWGNYLIRSAEGELGVLSPHAFKLFLDRAVAETDRERCDVASQTPETTRDGGRDPAAYVTLLLTILRAGGLIRLTLDVRKRHITDELLESPLKYADLIRSWLGPQTQELGVIVAVDILHSSHVVH